MLSLQQCRKILDSSHSLSDSELEQYRNSLYGLADIVFNSWNKKYPNTKKNLPFQKPSVTFEEALNTLSDSEKSEAIERACIIEFDSGVSRKEAEEQALARYLKNGKVN